ncbi:sn-glycerol 3-phosphate transport system substrate-binding protein [Paenibacillus phyllosphaerae]|uniref:sn-glycerol 3-phosphate transport system substrate-binding protein n=1 Tax=Paenibacillus phyllosphaerae TaxID=274593 RepID=A0A7W5AZF4_9BACL|nr:ABC transporter substrate-binding protein [Paenibacillus phyllosphaerae]MBB3111467.1 sn-glycerol 3-phosphate transport system substrate-binding protein [Paenibacillus phyllosphaerae]
MNKKLMAVTLPVLMSMTLAACGGGNTATNNAGTNSGNNAEPASAAAGNTAKTEAPAEKITIHYWYAFGGKIEEAKQALVKKFNESQDRIEVIAETQGGYDDLHAKVQAAFAAGNEPAISDLEIASTGVFARSGMLQDLTELAARDNDTLKLEDFNPGLMGNAYVDEKLYGLPFMRSTPILYKNVTMLKDAGLDPAGPKTWDELEQYSKTLKEKGKVGMTMPADIWFYEGLVAQSGGTMLSEDGKTAAFNSPEGVAPVEFWKKMASEGLIKIPVGDEAGATADKDWANQLSAFKFGSTAGVSGSLEIAKGNNFEMDASFMPANVSYGVPTGGCQLVITSKLSDEEKEAAWEFLKFMTTAESTIYQHKYVGYLPTRLSALESPELQEHFKQYPQYKVAVDQLEYARPRPMETAYPEVASIVKTAIEKAIIDPKVTPQDALNEAAEKANKLLGK